MRNDAHANSPRTGRSSSFFPTSLRAISSLLRNVSANTTNIAATVRTAGASVVSAVSLAEEERHREQVQWAGFDRLELGRYHFRHVLLLAYLNGFQVWDVEVADNVQELVSKRDGPVAFLRMQPRPLRSEILDVGILSAWPLLLVITGDAVNSGNGAVLDGSANRHIIAASPPAAADSHFVPTIVSFYSLNSHSYVRKLKFRTAIYAVRCSSRVVVVALAAQIYCFDTATLQNTFSALTYPSPQAGPIALGVGHGALAVGPRWLAYSASQPLVCNTGRVSPQHLTSPGVSPSTSPANGNIVAHYAKESSKQIAAGIFTLGDIGYKTLSRYYYELLPDGAGSPCSGSPNWKSNNSGLGVHSYDPEHMGTVMVRDFVNKAVIAQFRAHTSPLSALCFDPSGTLLVTASVYGHNLNVFRLTPPLSGNSANLAGFDASASYVHLYKLYRGMTQAIIQDISFSDDSRWIAISSSRGTSHLFAISPFGGIVGPHTHGVLSGTSAQGMVAQTQGFPWWSSSGFAKCNQHAFLAPPPTITLSVVSRIKNGHGGWRGTVTGAAATATGRNPPCGAVAVLFHGGHSKNVESEIVSNLPKDHLWVFSPPGHLIRHALRPSSAGTDGVYHHDGYLNTGGEISSQAQDLRVVIEPLQKWDVCRKPNWAEREDMMDAIGSSGGLLEETNLAEVRSGILNAVDRSTNLPKECARSEDVYSWYLSNAEVQMHQAKPPIWVKHEVSFHVFMGNSSDESSRLGEQGGEIEIEKFPSRVVEVRRKDLVPVFERIPTFRTGDSGMESLTGFSELNVHSSKGKSLQDGYIGMHTECKQIQRSSSGGSCESESGLFGGTTTVLHAFRYGYPAFQGIHTAEIPMCDALPVAPQTHRACLPSDRALSQQSKQDVYENIHPFFSGGDRRPLHLQSDIAPNVSIGTQGTEIAVLCSNPEDDVTSSFFKVGNHRAASEISAQHRWESSSIGENRLMYSPDPKQQSKFKEVKDASDYDGTVEDVESTDANSKSEDYDGREQGDDLLEETLFPFAEVDN